MQNIIRFCIRADTLDAKASQLLLDLLDIRQPIDHLISARFRADTLDVEQEQLWSLKEQMKISDELSSCHTAIIGDYFVEGHVPAEDIYRLLSEHPEGLGLTVPGMPMGSPGMDFSDEREPYETLLVGLDGTTSVFARHS